MRICHLILAHKNPYQVRKLLLALQHPRADLYIHLDKKVPATPFRNALSDIKGIKFIKKRVSVVWAGKSTVTAIATAIHQIRSSGVVYDFINLISGQDYPVKPAQEFLNYLAGHKGKNFIPFTPQHEGSEWWEENIGRFQRYQLQDYKFKGRFAVQRLANWVLPARKAPEELTLYGNNCSTWWTLDVRCAYYLAETILRNKTIRKFMRFTWGIDEIIFPTIVMNSPFRNTVINGNFRYIDWSGRHAHPKILTREDFSKLTDSRYFFARKFDTETDSRILDLIDQKLL